MLQALGYDFLDEEEKPVPFGAQGLEKLRKIADSRVLPELGECEFRIACDVENPLCGPCGRGETGKELWKEGLCLCRKRDQTGQGVQ